MTAMTRKDLDDTIAGVPDAVAAAVVPVIEAAVQPFIDKASANPEAGIDYAAEIGDLSNIGNKVSTSVSDALKAHFATLAAPAATDAQANTGPATPNSP